MKSKVISGGLQVGEQSSKEAVLEYKQLYLDRGTALYVSIPHLLFLMGLCSFLVESERF
jgi:hypothetical protein